MRWLIVSSRHHPVQGGIGAYVANAVRAAIDARWSVHLLTRPSNNLPVGATIHPVITFDDSPEFNARLAALRRIHRVRPYRYGLWSLAVARAILNIRESFDLISFVDTQAEGLVSLTSRRIRDHAGSTPMLIHAHGTMGLIETMMNADPALFGRSIYYEWEQQSLQAADAICLPSQILQSHMPVRENAFVLPPPMYELPIRKLPTLPLITFLGGLEPNKGPHVLARAMNAVFPKHESVCVQFIGSDTPSAPDGTSMKVYVQSLVSPQYRNRVRFLDALPHSRVLDRLAESTFVVVPSRFESFSYAAAETIMLGRFALITEFVGIRESLPMLPTMPFGDDRALADRIMSLLNSPQSMRDIAAASRAALIEQCAPTRFISNLSTILDQFTSKRKRQSASSKTKQSTDEKIDAIDAMEQVLRDIEREERNVTAVSFVSV